MKKNVGNIDRVVRIVVALVIAYLLYSGTIVLSSFLGILLAVVGVIFLFTALVGWCAIYQLVGASTCPAKSA